MAYSIQYVLSGWDTNPSYRKLGTAGLTYPMPSFLFSIWVCLGNLGPSTVTMAGGPGVAGPITVTILQSNIQIIAQDALFNTIYSGTHDVAINNIISNVIVSVDPVNQICQVYVNDQNIPISSGAGWTGAGELNGEGDWNFESNGSTPPGCGVGDVFMATPGEFFDLSFVNNRRQFINADLSPVDLGVTGSNPLGVQPPVFLTVRPGDTNPVDFINNNGFGGVWESLGTEPVFEPPGLGCVAPTPPPGPPPLGPPPAYLHFLTCCDRAIMAHLYQFTAASGAQDYFTDFDIDINYNNILWKSGGLRFAGVHRKVGVGVSVDEQTLKIWASPTDTMFGATFLTGAEEGLLDGATIVRQRIIWEFVTGNVAVDIQQPPLFVFTLFTGFMSQIVKGGVSHVEFKIKSAMVKLDVNMPRNYYQPGCLWTLYDQGCTLVKSSFAYNASVASAGPTTIATSPSIASLVTPTGADGNPYFAQGRLLFNSGDNEGLQVLIDTNDSSNLYLAYPLNTIPNPGDSITFYPGCSKTFATCQLKFNNQANFRGFDKVPPVFISM